MPACEYAADNLFITSRPIAILQTQISDRLKHRLRTRAGQWQERAHRRSPRRKHQGKRPHLDDVLTGYWEWFRKDGTRMRTGYFENGKQLGDWMTYDEVTTMKSPG
jgi:hypothetical protein